MHYCIEANLYFYSVIVMGVSIDLYTISFFILLGIVRGCVIIWSYHYMDGELAYKRFICLLIGFIIRMVFLIFFSNLVMTLIGWDGLGLTSFLLVIYYKNRKCLGSGMITGLTNRLGDCFFLCGLGFAVAHGNHAILLSLLTVLSLTKSAQVPFSAWLPSAMAAPTPVRALVHSSTLVTAGVYVLIRYCHSDAGTLINIGTLTMVMAGAVACAERDLKKVVALSTLSQLGLIIVSLGAYEKSYCFFHIISHAFFKALLFICVGTCIHFVYGTQDFRSFNSLWTSLMLSTFITVSSLSLMGFFFTAGFFSKESILELLYFGGFGSWSLFFFLLGVGQTSFYSSKLVSRVLLYNSFTGSNSYMQGGESTKVKVPLYVLGTFRLIFGYTQSGHCRLFIAPLSPYEKTLPTILISVGALSGYLLARLRSPLLRSMFYLTPFNQFFPSTTVITEPQKALDKGRIETGRLFIRTLSTVVTEYSTAVRAGLRVILITFFLYGKYSKNCLLSRMWGWWWSPYQ